MSFVERVRRAPAWVVDLVVVAVVGFPTVMDAWWNEEGTRQADWRTYVLAGVSVAVLVVRRRWPFAVAVVCGAALSGWYVLGHHGELLNLPTMVALYTVAVQTDRSTVIATGVAAATWSGILGYTSSDPIGARGGSPVLEIIWPLVPLAFGEATRSRRELLTRAAADREREAVRRVEVERMRIARELHDIVAHTIAAVNVQMAVAVAAFEDQPDTAHAALLEARRSTRDAMRELRVSVAVLRDPDAEHILAPSPRLAQIDELAETARAADIIVSLDTDLAGADLSPSVELAAYRIVQEAITNVVRHSAASHVAISLRTTGDDLVVEVIDDGVAGPPGAVTPPSAGGGYGLLGLAERATAVGGSLEHGRTADGFRVHAVLPTVGRA